MENNNNGRGIFYGVIGVATLVVAIIGATFAYFSASITRNSIVNIQSTTLTLEMPADQELTNFKTDLIPVETDSLTVDGTTTNHATAFSNYISLATHATRKKCIDDVGNSICSVYQFTVKNPSATTAQTVQGSIKVSTNGFTNLYYAVFKGADADITAASYAKLNDANALPTVVDGTTGASQVQAATGTMVVKKTKIEGSSYTETWTTTQETLSPTSDTDATDGQNNTTTYTVVVWLEETGSNQAAEMGASFAAGVTFSSEFGGGVTGIITAG